MANLHHVFLEFNHSIQLKPKQKNTLRTSRNAIRDKIRRHFTNISLGLNPRFHGQGSFIMNTIIEPESKEFDIDDGIYFISDTEPGYSIQTFHNWILSALEDHTSGGLTDKNTCVRVIYKASYHVDLPIYYIQSDSTPKLAHKSKGWIESDPREFISWFADQCDSYGQLRRIVRYLKVWSDCRKGTLPSGLIMSILAAENYISDARDDIALCRTLQAIHETLQESFTCFRPTTPNDEDLLASYSKTNKDYFLSTLSSFVAAAANATNDTINHKNACKKWQIYFGQDRFPFEDEEQIEEKFKVDLKYTLEIDSNVIQKGFRDKFLSAILRDNAWLLPERKLAFFIKTPPPISSYEVYWKVRNVGSEAIKRKQVRGQILKDDGSGTRVEHTRFHGEHYVECYIIQNNICVARDDMLVPIKNTPS